jgi:hypothetical protein
MKLDFSQDLPRMPSSSLPRGILRLASRRDSCPSTVVLLLLLPLLLLVFLRCLHALAALRVSGAPSGDKV